MSRFDYETSKRITAEDYPFYALIMAAMRQADSDNLDRLGLVFPEVRRELQARFNGPGGYIPGDAEYESIMEARRQHFGGNPPD